MAHQVAEVAGGKVQITFTLTPEERGKFEQRALREATSTLEVKGFRVGHAPESMVRERLGESLPQETMWQAVKELYPKLIKQLNLEVVGSPQLALQSTDPFVFYATVAKLPEVDLGAWEKTKTKRLPVEVAEADVDKLVTHLQDSRVREAAVVRAAQLGDRVELDFEVSVDGVVLEGGKESHYSAVLGHGRLLPGFEDNLVGLPPGQDKQFEITFPKEYRKDLAGKHAQVQAKVLQVFERTLPEITDEFASSLGQFTSAADLKARLKQNLMEDRRATEEQRVEREMLEALVERAKFGELPEILLKSEAEKMLHELKAGIAESGLEWPQYLMSIKKDETSLKSEFRTPAERRVKVALLVRAFAKREQLQADDMAVEAEIAHTLEHHANDERAMAQLATDGYRDYVREVLTNRKVIEWLKQKLVE